MSERFVLLSGCSGGGKSTRLEELRARGHPVVEEPGRRIVREELERGGDTLPWIDAAAFARRAIEAALSDRKFARRQRGWVFFDRGLIDAVSALEELTGERLLPLLGAQHRYHRKIFLAPPWPEIYRGDTDATAWLRCGRGRVRAAGAGVSVAWIRGDHASTNKCESTGSLCPDRTLELRASVCFR